MSIWFPTIAAGSGSDVYVRRLSEALRRRGVEATVTWLPRWAELAPSLVGMRPPVGTTVIHANSWNAFAFARFGLPVVATVHSPIHLPEARGHKTPAQRLYHDLLIRNYERRSLVAAATVVAVSAAVASATAAAYPGTELQVIHNFVDTRVFSPAPAPASRRFRLLFAGNRTPWKGWDLLQGLMTDLGEAFHLTIAAGLRADIPVGQLPPHTTSLGPVRDEAGMVRAYQSCDAVLVPSRLEGFGYVAAEAMACGKPVVAFRNSALPEIVADGRAGILVPTDDVRALAEACRRLAAEPGLASRMGEAARRTAIEKFSEDAVVSKYLELYARVAR